ncbi:uncharacterized protein LOC107874125 [Capsicum annuum]|uniref:uncharacterized protein LOC107874125 n=1 Tax=Capsicum annuum TaxID=4072 RepID=UPI001FB06642|nr:uncharacterized protein LOC107874125 [Capsicum annuum]
MATNKVKVQDVEAVTLTEECSFVVTQKMPKKLKDPGKFTLPILIGNSKVVQELSDLVESINWIPFSLFNTFVLKKPRPSSMLLQLENGTIAHPERVIEDVLIKVDEKSEYRKTELRNMAKTEYGVPSSLDARRCY